MNYGRVVRVLVVLVFLVAMSACAKKVPMQPGYGAGAGAGAGMGGGGFGGPGMGGSLGDEAKWRELGLNSEAERREFTQRAEQFENADVYFDFDAYVLSEPAKRILDDKAEFLKRYAKAKVNIEGHCDERGTNEYNLALGERRANSALQYLTNSGIGQQRMGAVSYGEERPNTAGHDETSWARNRRAHFVLNY